ncbi:hypothetical protein [Nonomuraea basaltis]|uniref:hypothetical protein n=1 Tax=Nonomuraea basaltis TaxID=2495887 RepID=UPI00110C612B|nr:hypothetical protein [Nonomuraea basaltis]TMS00303.1 hypothetical protein EJK15_02660 [Nonomuraea basaltis]
MLLTTKPDRPFLMEGSVRDVAAEIDQAVAFAEQAPLEPVEDLTTFVYSPTSPTSGTLPARSAKAAS